MAEHQAFLDEYAAKLPLKEEERMSEQNIRRGRLAENVEQEGGKDRTDQEKIVQIVSFKL